MTIVDLIKRDHDDVADMFDHLVVLARDGRRIEECCRVAARLVAAVRIHSRAEERVLYEVLRSSGPALKAFALAGPHEHENLHTTIDKLLVHRPGDDEYRVIVKVARDLFEMHARDEEEAEILPQMQKALTDDELRTLASDMAREESRIRPQILQQVGVPAPVHGAPSLRAHRSSPFRRH
jgi:hypothetical protein